MGQVWSLKNKCAQKFSPKQVEKAFEAAYSHIKENTEIIYMGEVNLFLLEEFGICPDTRMFWMRELYKDNISIKAVWAAIKQTMENRVVKDKDVMRSGVQSLVLQNKHGFREKTDVSSSHVFTKMPKITRNNVEFKIDLGD